MKRNRRVLLVALLVVVAFGLTAATLTNPMEPSSSSGSGPGAGPGVDSGTTETGQRSQTNTTASGGQLPISGGGACFPFLTSGTFLALAALAFLVAGLLLRRRTTTAAAIVILLAFFMPLTLLHGLFTKCGVSENITASDVASINGTNQTLSGTSGNGSGGAAEVITTPPAMVVIVLVVAVLLLLLVIRGSSDDEFEDEDPESDSDETLDDIAKMAGDAADRLEGEADLENAVYQAWWDMTDHLDSPSHETTTPAEFAEAAREAGMQARHVDTLTDLFREVRYGGEPVTEQRERRALDALRDIEATYGEEADE